MDEPQTVARLAEEIRRWRKTTGHYRPEDWRCTWAGRLSRMSPLPGEDFDDALLRLVKAATAPVKTEMARTTTALSEEDARHLRRADADRDPDDAETEAAPERVIVMDGEVPAELAMDQRPKAEFSIATADQKTNGRARKRRRRG